MILNVDTISFLTYSYTYQYLPTMPFALVRWVNGVEKGTHTVLDANWLMDVDIRVRSITVKVGWRDVGKV